MDTVDLDFAARRRGRAGSLILTPPRFPPAGRGNRRGEVVGSRS